MNNVFPTRRSVLALGAVLLGSSAGLRAQAPAAKAAGVPLEVWKDPECGCCKDWVAHLQANGFAVKVHEDGNNAVRARLGIDRKYASCHTGVVAGYAIEGHVPAREIHRLLKEKPQALGLSVPGMPIGAPGMDAPLYGDRRDPFDVLLLARDGTAQVYQRYEGNRKA